jgi:hypothetical protein
MNKREAERLAVLIQRECGADICDPCLVDQGDGTFTVWQHGWEEFGSVEEWEEFKTRAGEGIEV